MPMMPAGVGRQRISRPTSANEATRPRMALRNSSSCTVTSSGPTVKFTVPRYWELSRLKRKFELDRKSTGRVSRAKLGEAAELIAKGRGGLRALFEGAGQHAGARRRQVSDLRLSLYGSAAVVKLGVDAAVGGNGSGRASCNT